MARNDDKAASGGNPTDPAKASGDELRQQPDAARSDANDQTTPQGNSDVSAEGVELGQEYDRNTEARLEEEKNDQEELAEGVLRMGSGDSGVVATGVSGPLESRGDLGVGLQTTFPGISARFGTTDGPTAVRRAKALPETGIVGTSSNSWTAQSASAFTPSNAMQVPGQTYAAEELPDATVVAASRLPVHTIPAGLVVNPPDSRAMPTDSLSSSQQPSADTPGGGANDLGTAPKRNRTGPAGPA